MSSSAAEICVLNAGAGAWAFEPLARQLSQALGVPIAEHPGRFNYLLNFEPPETVRPTFIPLSAIRSAADKRLAAQAFTAHGVATPQTLLLNNFSEVIRHVVAHPRREWCLKFPVGCGASGHRLVDKDSVEPARWPRPWILQEFIRLDRPAVYRTYGMGGTLFGWVVRCFAEGQQSSPWVSHARGAHYICRSDPPAEARKVARRALDSVGFSDSFGCVDLLQQPSGEWLALEVGTDGIFNHVDRDLGDPEFERELSARLADAFWRKVAGNGLLVDSPV